MHPQEARTTSDRGKVHGERRSSHRVKLTLTPQIAGRADVKVSDQLEQLG